MEQTKQEIVIIVQDGVVELVKKPNNVKVILKDYDIEGTVEDLNEKGLQNDNNGRYVETELN